MSVERCIITPTFPGHFRHIPGYLESFATYVEDKDFPIYFIVNREDRKAFENLVADYRRFNLVILNLEDILEHFSIPVTPGLLLDKYGKFTFQSLKKWYAILFIDPKQSLILDSESMWVNPTTMQRLFDDYFAHPFLAYSDINIRRRAAPLFLEVVKNNDFLLRSGHNKWFLEHFCWFYDTAILRDLCNEFGSPLEIAEKLYHSPTLDWSLFETLFYHEYIYTRNERYHYRLINVDQALEDALGEADYKAYLDRFYSVFKGNAGVLEYATAVINTDDCDRVAKIFIDNHFKILRCEFPNGNYAAQKKFMAQVRPDICAVSQEHVFGLNKGRANRLLELLPGVDLSSLRAHSKAFAAPLRDTGGRLREGALMVWQGSRAAWKGARQGWKNRRKD